MGASREGTLIDGAELGTQMILINSLSNLYFRSLTIQNAKNTSKGAAIAANSGKLTMENCQLYNNESTGSNSGAIFVGTEACFEGCIFKENKAKTQGGAMSISGSTTADVIVNNCTFTGNAVTTTSDKTNTSIPNNGGGAIYHTRTGGRLLIDNSSFIENSALSRGGAIRLDDKEGTTLFINRSFFRSNTVSGKGYHQPNGDAAICQGDATKSKCALFNCTFSYNHASASSSATPVIRASRYVIANCSFVESTGTGYGLINSAATDATAATFVNNIATTNSTNSAHVSLSTKATSDNDGTATFNYLSSGYNLVTRILEGFTAANNDGTSKTGVYKSTIGLGDYDLANKCVAWGGDVSAVEGFSRCKLSDVETMIKANTVVGEEFWNWLKSIKVGAYDATQVDVRGVLRDPDAMWPGSYQDILSAPVEPEPTPEDPTEQPE